MKRILSWFLIVLAPTAGATRLKELVSIEGVREN